MRRWGLAVVVVAAVAASSCSSSSSKSTSASVRPKPSVTSTTTPTATGPCQKIRDTDAYFITPSCDDPDLSQPYTDLNEQRTTTDPETKTTVSYRYVHGGFTGTKTKFAFYFPAKADYKGRFFESTYPLITVEDALPATIAFGISNGAYVVSTNNNGGLPAGLPLSGYRSNAAAAKYSRVVAADVYGKVARPRGYIYGASGGAYQTIGAAENTAGIWDGAAPMVPGTPNAIPSNQAVELLGLRVLHDALPKIADSLEPGGSGDPYAGLTPEQASTLRETARLGFPVRGWWQYASLTGGSFSAVEGGVEALDPSYVTDFWSTPGYEGSDPAVRAARVQRDANVVSLVPPPACTSGQVVGTICPAGGVVLTGGVSGELLTGADLTLTSGAAKGKTITIDAVEGDVVHFAGGADPETAKAIAPGDSVRLDNSWVLALQYYPRHQVPSSDMYGWNQYRGENGTPKYPQRPKLLGPTFASFTGGVATGDFHGKMIMLGSVVDTEAYAWSADWYRKRVEAARGSHLGDDFRIWYMDNAGHTEPRSQYAQTHIVDYRGELEQALLDLDAWVRSGTRPPASTSYRVDAASAVRLPAAAADRKGVQPVVTLRVGRTDTVEVKAGEAVRFTATATMPPGTGSVVDADWDFDGTGAFADHTKPAAPARSVTLRAVHTYERPGTYLAVVRITGRRDGSVAKPYRRIPNLARVRIVVG